MSRMWHETIKQPDAKVGADTIRPTEGSEPFFGFVSTC